MQLVIQGKDAASLKEELYKAAVAFGATVDPDQIDLPLTPPAALVPTSTPTNDTAGDEAVEADTTETVEQDPFAAAEVETKAPKGKAGRPKGSTNKKAPPPKTKVAAPAASKKVVAATEAEAPVTVKDCEKMLREVNAKCGMPKCRAVLKLYDANRVRDLAKGDFAGFIAACEQALGE